MNTSQRVVLGAWLALIGLQIVRRLTSNTPGLPPPSTFLGGGVYMTAMYTAAGFLDGLPAAFAVGLPIAIVARPYLGLEQGPSVLQTLGTWLDQLSGQPASTISQPGGPASGAAPSGPFLQP